MSESLSIPGRFNGPLESGNGGYASGVDAGSAVLSAEGKALAVARALLIGPRSA